MKNTLSILLLFFSGIIMASEAPDHSIYNKLLQTYVSASGTVDYEGLKTQEKKLDDYLVYLSSNGPNADWSEKTKKAYYINAYNAYTIKFVLLKYPTKSVKDLSFSGKDIWNFRLVKLGGKTYTLDYLEKEILLKMRDARIHFAVNCASKSCPKLWNKAFTAANIDKQLTILTKEFINNNSHNVISAKKIKISKLFDWYADDFKFEAKSVIGFLNQYSTVQIQEDAKIEYLPYNWSLNE